MAESLPSFSNHLNAANRIRSIFQLHANVSQDMWTGAMGDLSLVLSTSVQLVWWSNKANQFHLSGVVGLSSIDSYMRVRSQGAAV